MLKHLLVPLDGSHMSEAALGPAAELVRRLKMTVTLIHVIEENPPDTIHGETHLRDSEEACRYLDGLAQQAFPLDADVESHVHTEEVRNVARSILNHAGEFGSDLIVMCAHGEGGLRDLFVGSIAQQIIGLGRVPVLLLRPDEDGRMAPVQFERIMVALDSNPEHDAGLSLAGDLAVALGAQLHLVSVVPTLETLRGEHAAAGRLLPATAGAMLDMSRQVTVDTLNQRARIWQARGVAVSGEVPRGDPADQIVAAARRWNAGVLVLGTHGKSGMGAFWAGSVSPQVTRQTRIPLLLVPVHHT